MMGNDKKRYNCIYMPAKKATQVSSPSENGKTYRIADQREHVVLNPDTYMGGMEEYEASLMIYDEQNDCMCKRKMITVEAIERLFLEVLCNAADAVSFSKRNKIKADNIWVSITDTTICIMNDGDPIPISMSEEENMMIPEMIFGVLLSSSNFDGDRMGGGKNGYGSKLANIMSNTFSCRIGNRKKGKTYFQKWSNRMDKCTRPKITEEQGVKDFVEITYVLDFSSFTTSMKTYSADMVRLFLYHCCNSSLSSGASVHVSVSTSNITFEKEFKCTGKQYVEKYIPGYVSSINFTYENKDILSKIYVCNVSDSGSVMCITNDVPNRMGGKHIDSIYSDLKKTIVDAMASRKEKDKRAPRVPKSHMQDYVSIVCVSTVCNPKFDAQTKTKLTSPVFSPKIPEDDKKKIMKWNVTNAVVIAIESISMNKANKASRSTSGPILKKVDDANLAGKKPELCTLFIVEGDSAKGYPQEIISNCKNGRDYIGIFPLQGKPLNALLASPLDILDNKVFTRLRKTLGLEEGKEYDSTMKGLRYHTVEILVDADEDGKHILGLILLFMYMRFRSLLKHKFLYYLRTPIIRVSRGTTMKAFFSVHEFDVWLSTCKEPKAWATHYFKGLGSSGSEDVSADLDTLIRTEIRDNKDSIEIIKLFFGEASVHADKRKEWLRSIESSSNKDIKHKMNINDILKDDVSQYMLANNSRSLPGLDGLKTVHRKILWTALKFCSRNKKITFLEFVGEIMKRTYYSHGDKSLSDAIILMTHNSVGYNNMPYFSSEGGQYGNRSMGPAGAAAPRYLKTIQSSWLPLVFMPDDERIYDFVYEHNEKAEPKILLPILPMCLINGVNGIGSGWKSKMASYNIDDICTWLKGRLQDKFVYGGPDMPDIRPWNRHYKGECIDDPLQYTITYKGIYIFDKDNDTLDISELPIGMTSNACKVMLDEFKKEKLIKGYTRHDDVNYVRFIVQGISGLGSEAEAVTKLKLIKKRNTSCMNLLGEDFRVEEYDSVQQVIERFYSYRLPYYTKRKDAILSEMKAKLKLHKDKLKLITMYSKDLIKIKGRKKVDVIQEVLSHGICIEAFNGCRYEDGCEDELDKLRKLIDTLEKDITALMLMSSKEMWLRDIQAFEKWYRSHIKDFDLFVPVKRKRTYNNK